MVSLQIDPHAGMLHDAVVQWGYGVNKTLEEGGRVDDGLAVTKNIINLTYEGRFIVKDSAKDLNS